jgi:hypothetical protein
VPRYRFRWENLGPALLAALCEGKDVAGEPVVDALRRSYGARPKLAFVAEQWPTLRDTWLAGEGARRGAVVVDLRRARLGDLTIRGDDRDSELRYLRSCRNQLTLRAIVLDAFIAAGERPPDDLKPSVPAPPLSWDELCERLTDALASLEDGQFLVVSVKGTGVEEDSVSYFVLFAGQGSDGLRAEAVANAFLADDERLSDIAVGKLIALGWSVPTDLPETPLEEQNPKGSVNFYVDYAQPVPFADAAQRACDTLEAVYGVEHPGFLRYYAFDRAGERVELPGLRVEPELTAPSLDPAHLAARLLDPQSPEELFAALQTTVGLLLDVDDVQVDDDGDIPIMVGSTVMFLRVATDAPTIKIFAQILTEVRWSTALLEAVNEINRNYPFVRAWWDTDRVMLCADVMASPYVEQHVIAALQGFGQIADEIDDDLQRRFGGRVFLGQGGARQVETGGYL